METLWWPQFLTIAAVHLLAVASPGPDFFMVMRQSVGRGRSSALLTSLGTTLGIVFHISYTLLGIGLIVSKSIFVFNGMKIAGAAFLIWMGWQALRAHGQWEPVADPMAPPPAAPHQSWRRAIALGFLTNALNPKATLFFLAFFSVVIDSRTPPWMLLLYALYMVTVHLLWYGGLSIFFTMEPVRRVYGRVGHWIERTMGAALILLGVRLLTWHRQ
jgi:RhtB (resistance to homoserine/threonine) family protein